MINVKPIDKLILLLCTLQFMLFNYLNIAGQTIKIICFLIILSIFWKGKIQKRVLRKLMVLTLSVVLCYISAKVGQNCHTDVLMTNIFAILYAARPLIYLSDLVLSKPEYVEDVVLKHFGLINGYGIFNVLVSIVQVAHPGFMAGSTVWVNTFDNDLISGTFGYSATPQFGLYFLFVLFYNIYYYIRKTRKWIIYLDLFFLIYILIFSVLNDNKAVYVELILFGVAFLMLDKKYNFGIKIKRKSARVYGTAIIAILALILAYILNSTFHDVVYNNIIYAFNLFYLATKSDAVFGFGSAERVYTVIYAFSKYDAIHLGYGTGSFWWQAGSALGFAHFGLADLGSFLCLGGIWFTSLIVALYHMNLTDILDIKKEAKIKGYVLAIVLILLFYSQIVTSNTINIILIYLFAVLGLIHRYTARSGDYVS